MVAHALRHCLRRDVVWCGLSFRAPGVLVMCWT